MHSLPPEVEQVIRKGRLRSRNLAKSQQNLDALCVAMQLLGLDAQLVSMMIEVKIQTVERNAHYKTALMAICQDGELYSLNNKGWRAIALEYTRQQYADVFASQIHLSLIDQPTATQTRTTAEQARVLLAHVQHAQLSGNTPPAPARRTGMRL